MRVLILGGTGLIGQALTSTLVSAGHQVWILSRNPESAKVTPGAEIEKWDGCSAAGWENRAANVDAIVNLASDSIGSGLWSTSKKERISASRVCAGKAVVEAVQKARSTADHFPQVVIQASAIGFYGPSDARRLDETTPAGTDFLAKVCLEWEASTKPVESMGVRRVIIRTGLVLSMAEGVFPRMLLPFRMFVGGPIGSGHQWYSWIHIRDEVNAICFLLENETVQGAYNLTAPEPVMNLDLGHTIAKVFKRPYWMPAPGFALKLALGEMSTLILDGQRVLPKRLMDAGYQFNYPQIDGALRNLLKGSELL